MSLRRGLQLWILKRPFDWLKVACNWPDHNSLWSFSQCLLAEAETLSLLQTTPSLTAPSTPLKLKQMGGDPKASSSTTSPDVKLRTGAAVDKPCKYFLSDSGCKAGRSWRRWQHSWEGVEDKSSRCLICGGKDHRKNDCKLKSTTGKKQGDPGMGSGGGRGAGGTGTAFRSPNSTTSTMGGKAGAAAVRWPNLPMRVQMMKHLQQRQSKMRVLPVHLLMGRVW